MAILQTAILFLFVYSHLGFCQPAQPAGDPFNPAGTATLNRERREKRNEDPACELKVSGPWMSFVSITVNPNPPKQGENFDVEVSITAKDIVWTLTMQEEVTLEGYGIIYRGNKLLCHVGTGSDICPMQRGERRHLKKTFNSGFLAQGTYSGIFRFINHDDYEIFSVSGHNCTLSPSKYK